MATSLGQAYSILGSAQGAEFKRRREEERDYYATQERKARQNMLLGYLVKPIGEQIAAGVSDVIAAPFRDPMKKLLDSEQARSFKSDINKLNKYKTSLVGIQKQITDKHSGDTNSYAIQKVTEDKTREVFSAYQAQYSGLTDAEIRDSKTDIGIAYRKDLAAELKTVNEEAAKYATNLNNAFTAAASMSTSAEITEALEKVTPYSKGIVSKVWNMGSSLFRGEPMLGGPSKARKEESLLKAREILDFTTEDVEDLTTVLEAGASNRAFEESLITKSLKQDIKNRTEYFDFLDNESLSEDVAAGKYGNNFSITFNSLIKDGTTPTYREVRNKMQDKYGINTVMSGDDIKNIQDKLAATNPELGAVKEKFIVDLFNSKGSAQIDNLKEVSSRILKLPAYKEAEGQWDLVNRAATRMAADSVFNEYERLSPQEREAFLSNTSKESQIKEVENRTMFIIQNSLETKTETTDKWVMPNVTTDKYTGFLKFDEEAFKASKQSQPATTTTTPPSTSKPVIPFTKDIEEELKAVYFKHPDDFADLVEKMRNDPRYSEGFPDYETIKLMRNTWKGATTTTTPTVGSTAARVSGGVGTDSVLDFNQRRVQEAQEQFNQAGSAVSSTVASLRKAGSEAMREAYPATDRTVGGPTTTRSAVRNAPGTMGAEPLVVKVLNTITDREGQQQLLENIRPKGVETTSEPAPKEQERSLLDLPVKEGKTLPKVTTKDRKAEPVNEEITMALAGTDAPDVDKVKEYLDKTKTKVTEDVLSDLIKTAQYDPDVIELLRERYNYVPQDLSLRGYPQFNPAGSIEDKVKFMLSLGRGNTEDFMIDLQRSKIMSEDDLKLMTETYLNRLKKGNT